MGWDGLGWVGGEQSRATCPLQRVVTAVAVAEVAGGSHRNEMTESRLSASVSAWLSFKFEKERGGAGWRTGEKKNKHLVLFRMQLGFVDDPLYKLLKLSKSKILLDKADKIYHELLIV